MDPNALPLIRQQVLVSCTNSGEPFMAELDVPLPAGIELVSIEALGPQA